MESGPRWKIATHPWLGISIFVFFLLLCYLLSYAEHINDLSWMRPYRDAHGMGCCSEADCIESTVSIEPETDQESPVRTVRVNGVTFVLPRKSIHASETAAAYWCYRSIHVPPSTENTRCVFYAIGG